MSPLPSRAKEDISEKHPTFGSSMGAGILETCYGLSIAEHDDKYINMFKRATSTICFITPGASPILEFFPVLARTPTWVPGTGFKRKAVQWRETLERMVNVPFTMVRQRMVCYTMQLSTSCCG